MLTTTLATRTFHLADQARFAALSGDCNPLHLDPVLARRLISGQVVVHGIHHVLWLLDAFARQFKSEIAAVWHITRLRAQFPNAVLLEQVVDAVCVSRGESAARLQVRCQNHKCCDLRIEFAAGMQVHRNHKGVVVAQEPATDCSRGPLELSAEQITGAHGKLPLDLNAAEFSRMFPALAGRLSVTAVAQLLATTRLVGMVCPGLHSVYSGLDLQWNIDHAPLPALHYRTTEYNPTYSLVRMAVDGGDVQGDVESFLRPAPQNQPPMQALRSSVQHLEFAGQDALIIGGSRGLGEVTAKLIAAGGGNVTITYARGEHDARQVAGDIASSGGHCDIVQYDTYNPESLWDYLKKRKTKPTHVYYFASPKIFVQRSSRSFDAELFGRFKFYYVDALEQLLNRLSEQRSAPLVAFNPSTTAIDENLPALAEYAQAKLESERWCASRTGNDPQVRILTERLPRIATDQTATVVPYPAADAVDIMLPIVRQMQSMRMHADI